MNVSVRISTHWNHASMRHFAVDVLKLNCRVMDVEALRQFAANGLQNSVAL